METLRRWRRAARMFWRIAAAQQQKSQACSADGAASLTFLADRVGFEPTSRLRDYLISSLLCNCDGGVRFGVVSVSPVPAESRLKSGFFARKALRDGLF